MKRSKLYFAAVVVIAIILSSCKGLNKMVENAGVVKYETTPKILEMHGGKVNYKITGKFPEKYFNKKAILTLTPILKYEGGELSLTPVVLQGEGVQANNTVINSVTGGSFETSGTFDYTDVMMKSELIFKAKVALAGKEDAALDLQDIKLADGIIATPNLVDKKAKVIAEKHNFSRTTANSIMATINYLIQSSQIRPTELKDSDIKKFEEYLKSVVGNQNITLKSLEVNAYASPDGAVNLNEKVSTGRQKTAQEFLKGKVKKTGLKLENAESVYNAKSVTEDWDGFKKLVQQSSIQDKDLILRVLSMYSDPDVREKEIKNMAATFEVLAKEILPQLRRSDIAINVDVIGYSDNELTSFCATAPDTLSNEELLYSATLVESMDEKLKIYKAAADKFPNDSRAVNNVGYAEYQSGNVAAAKEAFQKSKELKDGDIVNNNLGAISFMEGDLAKAEEMFTASLGAGEVANHNLGLCKLIKGEYESAVNYYGAACDNNAGLAKLLQGNNDAALKNLECITEPDALTYYLKAIIGSRTDNENLCITNLRNACSKDAKYKTYAKKDLEFYKYFDNEAFKGIVE